MSQFRSLLHCQLKSCITPGNRTPLLPVQKRLVQSPIWHKPWHQVRCYATPVDPNIGPNTQVAGQQDAEDDGPKAKQKAKEPSTLFKMMEAALTTFASVAILGLVGYSYNRYYKYMVLQKMENAFKPGDPILDIAALETPVKIPTEEDDGNREHWVLREEQQLIDDIVAGRVRGQYHLLVGEKGTGKSSMLIDAMSKIDAEGCAMFDAHADAEIFRIRLGKALDFEFHEDNIGSLFSIRGPRDANALLDIERAFNKLDKVALRRRAEKGKPLILIIGSMHLIRDDEEGKDLLELIQQRAEQWAASNLATVIFNSDDYWVYERLKQYATRMHVIPILDLNKEKAMDALRNYRVKYRNDNPDLEVLAQVYDKVGGRISFLSRVAKSNNMLDMCDRICRQEKTWFLSQCGILGMEMDDDVMDQQKYASAAMVLAQHLVKMDKEMEVNYDPVKGHILPQLPLNEARYVMTRADFIRQYDAINIFAIDSNAMVRADSVPMMNAFREVCSQPGFDEFLEATLDRISDIESLGRTKELTIKDLWKKGSKYRVKTFDTRGRESGSMTFQTEPCREEVEEAEEAEAEGEQEDS